MSKTYSFPKLSVDADPPRAWENRWTKKFGTFQKPITVPAAMIEADYSSLERATLAQAGVVDLPPEPSPDLSPWYVGNMDQQKASKLLIDWKASLDTIARSYVMNMPLRPVQQMTLDEALATKIVPLEKKLDREGTSISSNYLHAVYEPAAFQRTVELIAEMMRPHLDSFDAIAFRGSSGGALAYPLGYLLKKPLVHIRKELGHSSSRVEGLMGAKRVAVVDDFVASGNTIRTIMEDLAAGYAERGYAAPKLAHLFLYAERCSSSEGATRGAVGEILDGCEIHLAYDS